MSNSRTRKSTGITDNTVHKWEKATIVVDRPGERPDWLFEDVYEHAVNEAPGHTYLVTDKEGVFGDYDRIFRWSDRRSDQSVGRITERQEFRDLLDETKVIGLEGDLEKVLETHDDLVSEVEADVFVEPDHTYASRPEFGGYDANEGLEPLSDIKESSQEMSEYGVSDPYGEIESEILGRGLEIGKWSEEKGTMAGAESPTSPGFQWTYRPQD